MQLTKLDRWLKERFIYETHILTLRLPEVELPDGAEVQDVEQCRKEIVKEDMRLRKERMEKKIMKKATK